MANYPQLDDLVGVWKLKEVNDALMGGYWREAGSRGVFMHDVIDFINIASTGNATDFGDAAMSDASDSGGFSSFTRGVVNVILLSHQ